jgi:hypothetical protein
MILKFSKSLNDLKEFTLIQIDKYDKIVDLEHFNDSNSLYETPEYYYFFISKIIDLGDCEKFKIIAKKGDIVSLTARDNSYLVFPSKKTFAIAFNLKYHEVLQYKWEEVIYNGKPYEVKYIKEKSDKVCDGVVYTLSQLSTYISSLIQGYNYRQVIDIVNHGTNNDDKIKRVIQKYYDSNQETKTHKLYELNIKKTYLDENNKWHSFESINISKSNKYLYDYYLIWSFAYMILAKSLNDVDNKNDAMYCFNENFAVIDEVYDFLEQHQEIVNNFFIESDILFNNPNSMFTGYAPYINGVYMFYEYNNVKTYIYRNIDRKYFIEKSLKATYVSKRYRHNIKGIKNNYTIG